MKLTEVNFKPRLRNQKLGAGDNLTYRGGGRTIYTVYRPPRPKNQSPVSYYRQHGVVDKRFSHIHKGRYYCNPAHCSRSWKRKDKRDTHINMAYAIL